MESTCAFFGTEVARHISQANQQELEQVTEIRLRADKPLILKLGTKEYVISENGRGLMPFGHGATNGAGAYCPSRADIYETMERISRHSFYAFETELAMGYITLPGGHRVGVAGQVVLENGAVRSWKHIGGINIRIAHSVFGCGSQVLPHIYKGGKFLHTMIIAPPGCGKTTLLRDIVRQISNMGTTVGLVDERSEVAGCFQGVPQNDVGMRTDVLDGCPKAVAMDMLLRAMSPNVIAVDELGGTEDARAVDAVINAGIKLLCTAHGVSVKDVTENPSLAPMLSRKVFERFIVLGTGNVVEGVFDGNGVAIAV